MCSFLHCHPPTACYYVFNAALAGYYITSTDNIRTQYDRNFKLTVKFTDSDFEQLVSGTECTLLCYMHSHIVYLYYMVHKEILCSDIIITIIIVVQITICNDMYPKSLEKDTMRYDVQVGITTLHALSTIKLIFRSYRFLAYHCLLYPSTSWCG